MTGLDIPGWAAGVLAILGVLGGGGAVAALITRRVRPATSMVELVAAAQKAADDAQAERDATKTDMATLRVHIADLTAEVDRVTLQLRTERVRGEAWREVAIARGRQIEAAGGTPTPAPDGLL